MSFIDVALTIRSITSSIFNLVILLCTWDWCYNSGNIVMIIRYSFRLCGMRVEFVLTWVYHDLGVVPFFACYLKVACSMMSYCIWIASFSSIVNMHPCTMYRSFAVLPCRFRFNLVFIFLVWMIVTVSWMSQKQVLILLIFF